MRALRTQSVETNWRQNRQCEATKRTAVHMAENCYSPHPPIKTLGTERVAQAWNRVGAASHAKVRSRQRELLRQLPLPRWLHQGETLIRATFACDRHLHLRLVTKCSISQ